MPPVKIREHHLMQPFRPFRVHVSDGTHYDVLDPFQMAVGMLDVYIAWEPDEGGVPTKSVFISPNHVSRIEPLPAEPIRENVPSGNRS
jgi:hypothetical protein